MPFLLKYRALKLMRCFSTYAGSYKASGIGSFDPCYHQGADTSLLISWGGTPYLQCGYFLQHSNVPTVIYVTFDSGTKAKLFGLDGQSTSNSLC